MKKTIALCMAVILLLGMAVPAFAVTDTTNMEQVLLSVKERLPDTENYPEFQCNERQTADGITYNMVWLNAEQERALEVTVTDKGVITRYSIDYDRNYDHQPKILEIKRDYALEQAQKMVAALNPDMADQILVYDIYSQNSLWNNGFSFEVIRMHNDTHVPENSGMVTLDEKAEKILDFYITYNDIPFEEADLVLDKVSAQQAFAQNIGMHLRYEYGYDYSTLIQPIYEIADKQAKISAVDGSVFTPVKWADTFGTLSKNEAAMDTAAPQVSGGSAGLSRVEALALGEIAGLLSKEECVQKIIDNPYIAVDDTFVLNSFYGQKNAKTEQYSARIYLQSEARYANVSMDLKTGEILSFWVSDDESVPPVADPKANALAAVTALAGDKLSEYREEETDAKNCLYYVRYANGIPYPSDTVTVNWSEQSGIITNYYLGYTQAEFQPLDNVISEQEAMQNWFMQFPYTYSYTKHIDESGKAQFKLIMDFESCHHTMNPFTGKVSIPAEDIPFTGYTDMEGHWAKEAVYTLAEYGIRSEGTEFTPDATITQGDFVKLLGCLTGRYGGVLFKSASSYTDTSWVKDRGIADDIDEEAPLDRLTAAKLFIRTLELGEIAEMESIYACPFADVTEDKGYVSLLYGYGVFKGDGNDNFKPAENITYAEAAIMLYNYLTR